MSRIESRPPKVQHRRLLWRADRLRYRSRSTLSPATEPTSHDPVSPFSWLTVETTGSRMIGAYGLLLIVLILLYYSVLTAVTVSLTVVFQHVANGPWVSGSSSMIRGVTLLAIATVMITLALQLWQGLRGLVTRMHEGSGDAGSGVVLARNQCPDLYRTVAEVGVGINAPLPAEIRVTDRAECYVCEERKFGVHTHRRLVLVLGLPHLAVLSVAELKAILAHELAHFRSGDTTFGIFIYRFLESLRVTQQKREHRWWSWVDPIYWLSKSTFHLFLVMVTPIRQYQELRADCTSASYCGGELAARTLLKEWLLSHQFDVAAAEFRQRQQDNAPCAEPNAFRYFTARWLEFSVAGCDYLERRLSEEEQPGYLDSHPTTQARLAIMRRFPARKIRFAIPARCLLNDFNAIEQQLYAPACDPSESSTPEDMERVL